MKKISQKDMILMLNEQMNMSTLDLLGDEEHTKKNNLYLYAVIISKYSTSLKPVNYGTYTANDIGDIIKDKISGKYDILLIGLKEPMSEITDEYFGSILGGILPTCQKEIRDYYESMMS